MDLSTYHLKKKPIKLVKKKYIKQPFPGSGRQEAEGCDPGENGNTGVELQNVPQLSEALSKP